MVPAIPSINPSATSGASAGGGATKIVVSGGTDNLNRALTLWGGSPYNGGYGYEREVNLTAVRTSAGISTPLGSASVSLGIVGLALLGFFLWTKRR